MNKLESAFKRFDEYNSEDPNNITWNGESFPAELFYALKLYEWVLKLKPSANEALLLASRSQHIGRWKIPRKQYPMNRVGYLTWRSDLAMFHADTAGALMQQAGYEQEIIESVQQIILKKQIKKNEDVQVMENALCLVFLEYQYEDFIRQHDEEKIINIIRKSWRKMDEDGHQAASHIAYSGKGKELVMKALTATN
jgi:hypothetical protein